MVFFIGLPIGMVGQNLNLSITDSATKAPLPYANLYFKSSGIGASTNTAGHVKILLSKLNDRDTAVISYIGYQTKRVFIDKNQKGLLEISLFPSENFMPFPDSSIFKSTHFSSIRYYKKNYNTDYWKTIDLPEYLKLPKKLIVDLK